MKYLLTFQPLEPYTFMEEGDSCQIFSSNLPSQSTLLGTIRYLLLKKAGLLKTSCQYSQTEKEKMDELIGPRSFSFRMNRAFSGFGKIRRLSPVFLLEEEKGILIANPYCNLSEESYLPLRMGRQIQTSWGRMALPEPGQGLGERGHGEGFLRLDDMKVIAGEEIFLSSWDLAASFSEKNGCQQREHFKREKKIMKAGYSFAVLADFEEAGEYEALMPEAICFMGKKSAAFSMKATLFDGVCENVFGGKASLEEYVEGAFREYRVKKIEETGSTRKMIGQLRQTWYYALSDLYVGNAEKLSMYAMTEVLRPQVLSAGTVFQEEPGIPQDQHLLAAGYNVVVQIGG
ncbi:MAG: hypothetical protein MJ097_02740 [Dorea sp.]|nr:hypothetical protein [Dorea sp.]